MRINIYQPLAIYETGQRDNQEDSLQSFLDQANSQIASSQKQKN